MSPRIRDRSGRVRLTLGAALGLGSLGLACWLICQPASAIHRRNGTVHAAATPAAPHSVVASSLRSVPRLADPGTPIPDELWSAARSHASVRLDPELARSLVARSIPAEAELRLDTAPGELEAPIGSVTRFEDGSLRVIDGWTNGREDLQVELRLAPSPTGPPSAEGGVWDVRSGEAPRAWSALEVEVVASRSSWSAGDSLHLRYRALGTDCTGVRRAEGGLVRIVVP